MILVYAIESFHDPKLRGTVWFSLREKNFDTDIRQHMRRTQEVSYPRNDNNKDAHLNQGY